MKLSIVSPVYMAEGIVDELVAKIMSAASQITEAYEIILIEDGSSDRSWLKIEENCHRFDKVIGVKFSRNFGQHNAITAGLELAKGDYVIVMDCDLQDDPKYFREMVEKADAGFQIVYTRKEVRMHGFFKNLVADIFYKVFNFLVDDTISKGSGKVGSYSLITRKVVESYKKVGDYRTHYLMVLRWLGFSYDFVTIEHLSRQTGRSSYTFKKLIEHALNGITSQSIKLLNLTAYFGLMLSVFSFIAIIAIVISYLIHPFQAGWASIMVLILLVGGLIILSVGICGIYIGRTFEQTKGRPHYLIEEHIDKSEKRS